MESRARLKSIAKDIVSGKWNISFECDYLNAEELQKLFTDDLALKVEKFRERRSMNANAYFHLIVGKIADSLSEDKTVVKNNLICAYGQQMFIDGKVAIIKTQIPPELMGKQEQLHAKPCGTKIENGLEVFYYQVYRGSHEYNTEEMAHLIDGAVQDAKDLGIDTLPPQELERMVANWKA